MGNSTHQPNAGTFSPFMAVDFISLCNQPPFAAEIVKFAKAFWDLVASVSRLVCHAAVCLEYKAFIHG